MLSTWIRKWGKWVWGFLIAPVQQLFELFDFSECYLYIEAFVSVLYPTPPTLFKDQQYDQVQVGSGKRVMVECTHRTNVCVHLCTSAGLPCNTGFLKTTWNSTGNRYWQGITPLAWRTLGFISFSSLFLERQNDSLITTWLALSYLVTWSI